MDKKSQVLVISLWILAVLVIMAVGIAHRVSLALRLSRYQKDALKTLYLAKAGVNRAIAELEQDTNGYDELNESWSNNEEVFKSIQFDNNQNEFASVSYQIVDEYNKPKAIYGIRDEERKININTAPKELLLALLEKFDIENAQDKVNNILIWRGDIADDKKIYDGLGYPCKADKLSNTEELLLVKDITPQDYQKLKELITVYTEGPLNINTASYEALTILAHSIAKSLSVEESFADSVIAKILELRNRNGYFKEKSEINISFTGDEETNIFNSLMTYITLQSNNFLIVVSGYVGKMNRVVEAVYSRKDKQLLYWHET